MIIKYARDKSPPKQHFDNHCCHEVIQFKIFGMKKYFSTAFFLFFSFVSCRKESTQYQITCNKPTTDKTISQALLQGKWEWVSEHYIQPVSGTVIDKTPQTEGYSRQIVFRNSTELELYKNNISSGRYKYDIDKESKITLFPNDSVNVLIFKEYASGTYYDYVHFEVCNDTLVLNFQITTDIKGKEKWAKK